MSSILCPFQNIFGKPGEGAHAYRFAGLAVVDVVGTLLLAFGTKKYISPEKNFFLLFLAWLALATIIHWVFCVDTALLRFILGNKNSM